MAGSANLNVMMKIARKAGRTLLKDFGEVENLQMSAKGPADFVTRAERESESVIREALIEARPTYGYLGAAGSEIDGEDPTRRWIVDPLNGATNFLHGTPHWAVSIALEHKGQTVAGVVYDPAKDEMYYAEKGEGAWMNESRLRVSARSKMIDCVFATGIPGAARVGLPAALRDLAQIMPVCAGVRSWGATALDLSYVAAGRFDGFWERGQAAWDMAAGLVIVREAGGMVEPLRKGGNIMDDNAVICSNEPIFDQFTKVIRSAKA
ncbi:MAG: myo-inositol-1(or 4)-monophosphatase [Paracoccaceae bacterium]|jgi:myo-inositol-1(or 4)-monophosphatase